MTLESPRRHDFGSDHRDWPPPSPTIYHEGLGGGGRPSERNEGLDSNKAQSRGLGVEEWIRICMVDRER